MASSFWPAFIPFLAVGIILGLSAGFSPGPLFALVLSYTVRHGIREGCKVALAPLVTDLPIIFLATLLLSKLSGVKPLLGGVSLAGGLFVLRMSYETFRSAATCEVDAGAVPKSLLRGVWTNLLSPHPYLFWVGVGAPTILKGWSATPLAAVAFVAGFMGSLVGSKVLLALLVGKTRRFMAGGAYRLVMRGLGASLVVFALLLLKEGAELMGWAAK